MSYLKVTLIDVGWGDSILIEASDGNANRPRFALIDSNDNAERDYWASWNFLRKHFGLREDEFTTEKPFFDFVMLTHDHSDHGSGLKRIMQTYGTQHFWYPKVDIESSTLVSSLLSYVNHYRVQIPNQAVDSETELPALGDASLDVLWPPPNTIDKNPNNNSIVLALKLRGHTILLTGDAEGKVWAKIADQIPASTRAFKVPHHGSKNGTLYKDGFPWVEKLDTFRDAVHLGISSHPNYPNRFDFPHQEVLDRITTRPYPYYRTDTHYHVTFNIDKTGPWVRFSH